MCVCSVYFIVCLYACVCAYARCTHNMSIPLSQMRASLFWANFNFPKSHLWHLTTQLNISPGATRLGPVWSALLIVLLSTTAYVQLVRLPEYSSFPPTFWCSQNLYVNQRIFKCHISRVEREEKGGRGIYDLWTYPLFPFGKNCLWPDKMLFYSKQIDKTFSTLIGKDVPQAQHLHKLLLIGWENLMIKWLWWLFC